MLRLTQGLVNGSASRGLCYGGWWRTQTDEHGGSVPSSRDHQVFGTYCRADVARAALGSTLQWSGQLLRWRAVALGWTARGRNGGGTAVCLGLLGGGKGFLPYNQLAATLHTISWGCRPPETWQRGLLLLQLTEGQGEESLYHGLAVLPQHLVGGGTN